MKKKLIIIIAAVLVAAVGIGGYFILTGDKPDDSKQQGGLVFDPNAKDYDGDDPEDRGGADQGIKIPGYGTSALNHHTTDHHPRNGKGVIVGAAR